MGSNDFITILKAADILRVSRLTIYRYITSGKLPAYQFGRSYRIKRVEFEKFIESRRTTGRSK